MSTLTAEEMAYSINGFDEIAIARQFGQSITGIYKSEDELLLLRAFIFVAKRREGLKDAEAWNACMEIRSVDLGTFFADSEPEVDVDDPETEVGKEEGLSG